MIMVSPAVGRASESLLGLVKEVIEAEGAYTNPHLNPREATPRAAPQAALGPAAGVVDNAGIEVLGLIVKFSGRAPERLAADNQPPPAEMTVALSAGAGAPLEFVRAMSMGFFLYRFTQAVTWEEAERVLANLRKLAVVEHVEPDFSLRRSLFPNAPALYDQWPLAPAEFYAGGVNAVEAWDLTTGSRGTVVAVLDTGISAAAIQAIGQHRVLPGFDFVTELFTANDGDARDPDPMDPGDWAEPGDCGDNPAMPSSWHGSHVAGTLAAAGNDGRGIAGLDWSARVLPVRVLGTCGGSFADVIDGMLWSVGHEVPGVPRNPHPARVLNLSLGGPSPRGCTYVLQRVVNAVRQKNALIVVAAGNDDVEAATSIPAACEGVLTVGAVDHRGLRASYSNYSFMNRVHLSAPGGDISYYGDAGAGILSVVDGGVRRPTGGTRYRYLEGTSMAAPHVSGVASLALALDPDQHIQMVGTILRVTSRPFPQDSSCDTLYPLCGEGLLDARAALEGVRALRPYHLVWGFYNPDLNHYFRAGGYEEVDLVLSGVFGRWIDTEDYFMAWRDGSSGAQPVCRFYGTPGRGPNSHFYTADRAECEAVKRDPGWQYEGIAFYAKLPTGGICPEGTAPIYRYYNQRYRFNDSNHRFATHLYDKQDMLSDGWVLEGVAMCGAGG